jgi:hypothetical protein
MLLRHITGHLRDAFQVFGNGSAMENQNKPAAKCRRQRCARTGRGGHQREPEGADPLVLHTLTLREEKIMGMRFGLEDDSEHSLEKVGRTFAVTRERIRQIESKALRKLRQPSRSGKLRLFLDNVHE